MASPAWFPHEGQPPVSQIPVSGETPAHVASSTANSAPTTPAPAPTQAPAPFSYGVHQNVNTSGAHSGVKSNPGIPMVVQPPVPGLSSHGAPSFSFNIPQSGAAFSSNQLTQSSTMAEYNESSVKRAKLESVLRTLLSDPILSDVPSNPTLEDVDTLISFELGSAMRISVLKLDGTSFDVTMMNSATVKDLKLSIKKKVNEMEQSNLGHRHISWRHVWANYCLAYQNSKLLNDDDALQIFGVRNNSQVHFVSYVMTKESRSHSKRRKHRFFHGLNKLSLTNNGEG